MAALTDRIPPYEPSRPAAQMLAGDPLRAVAALSVLAYHVVTVVQSSAGGTVQGTYGTLGGAVLLDLTLGLHVFFALTGYLLSRRFIASYVDGRPWPSVRNYARNRALRILPAFWALLAISLVVFGTAGSTPTEIGATFGLMQLWVENDFSRNFSQAWSLHVEAVFYVLMPIGVWMVARATRSRLGRRGRRRVALAGCGLVWVAGLVLCVVGPPIAYTICAFIPGVLLAVVEPDAAAWFGRRPRLGRRLATAAAVLSVPWLVAYALPPVSDYAARAFIATFGIGLALAAVLIRQWSDGTTSRVLDNAPMRWVGERAYSVYLLHFVIVLEVVALLEVGRSTLPILAGVTVVVGALTLLGAWLSFALFEKPFLSRRARS